MSEYRELLTQFIKFKSISTDPNFKDEIINTVQWLSQLMESKGLKVEIIKGFANPIILAEYKVSEDKETCLVYGHYDVQPASKEDGWSEDPFEINEIDGKFLARGIMDNKGQLMVHLITIFRLIEEKNLGYNIKIMIEGAEEIGSPGLTDFIKSNKEKLKADFLLLSDSGLLNNQATLEAGLRGVINLGVKLTTSDHEVHSGVFGGTMPNAAHELVKLLNKIHGEDSKILIPGFYDDVDPVNDELKNREIKSEEELMKITGTKKIFRSNAELDLFSQAGLMPSIEITTLKSGYLADGYKNSIPFEAEAKLNVRIVEKQNEDKVQNLIKDFLKSNAPDYVDLEFHLDAALAAVKIDTDNQFMTKLIPILKEAYGNEPIIHYTGGSLPLIKFMIDLLQIPVLSVPLANEGNNMHGADENFKVEFIEKGLKLSYEFLKNE